MIEFKVASLKNSPESGDFWQGLNAASVALQQAAQSETAVYQVFAEQLVKLGLHGTVNLLDESGENLRVTSMVFSARLMRLIKRAEKLLKINSQEFCYPADASPADETVLTKGDVVFLHDNSEKMRLVIPPNIYRVVSRLIGPFLKIPAILAPIFAKSEVIGVLYIAGANLRVEDVSTIAAFSTHLSIALENARLFQAVQRAESQYRRLFESANEGIFLFDQHTRQLISANPKMLSLLGIKSEDIGTIRPSSWATPDIYQLYKQHLALTLENGTHFFEIPYIAPDGDIRQWQISATLVDLEGRPMLNGLVRDVTESRRAEEELRQREEQQRQLSEKLTQQTRLLEAILAATPDNFLVFDLNGRLQFISLSILEFLGFSLNDVVGKTWQELQLPVEFGKVSDQDRASVLQTGKPVSREFQFPWSDGLREIEFVTNPVLDNQEEVVSFVTTARDVTEWRQTVRAMHRAQKMESLGILAGGIAHDFNNLLVAMLGQASLAQTYLDSHQPAHGHISKVVQAAEQAAGLTQQLLAYSGGGQFSIKLIDLNRLIQESMDLFKVALPKQIILEFDLVDDLPLIEGDKAQLQQVLMNLVINGAEAIGEQTGRICVQTAVRHITQEDQRFWRYTDLQLPTGNYVSLRVEDDGEGMEPENIVKIFDPFFTTKFTGRGLGLAAVLGIVRSHRGGLWVSSEPEDGTVFELLLPISTEVEPVEAAQPEVPVSETAVTGLVLVIDDERAVREAVADILEMEGMEVIAAANGDEGIALYQAQASEIDLVLLDLSMPGKSGRETFEILQQFDPDVRIMLSSGYSEEDATRGFATPPLVGFLQKPYRLDTFIQRMQEFMRNHKL